MATEVEIGKIRSQLEALLSGQENLAYGQARLERSVANIVNMDVGLRLATRSDAVLPPRSDGLLPPCDFPVTCPCLPQARVESCPQPSHLQAPCPPQPLSDMTPCPSSPKPSFEGGEDDEPASVKDQLDMDIGGSSKLDESVNPETLERPPRAPRHSVSGRSKASFASPDLKASQNLEVYKRRTGRLKTMLKRNDELERKDSEEHKLHEAQQKNLKRTSVISRLRSYESEHLEACVDSVMCALILLNTVIIGLSLDHKEGKWNVWLVLDIIFACIFLCEFTLKLILHGVVGHFCGSDRCANTFDTIIIFSDAVQVVITMLSDGGSGGDKFISLFRVVRLVRLLRIIRLLKSDAMKGLMDMVQGVMDGATTLAWAVGLFLLMVYIMAVVCRLYFGRASEIGSGVHTYFRTVPRAMFTIFRCSFGDCGTDGGLPLPEIITEWYGGGFALFYCAFVFFITIGLFNVISAIFVDATMTASAELERRKSQERLEDHDRLATCISVIIKELLAVHPDKEHGLGVLKGIDLDADHIMDSLVAVEFQRATIDEVVHGTQKSQKVEDALSRLDIDQHDHKRLSDILDPDHSGTIGMLELVEGLRRLRGEPRRSDVVAIDLMVRSAQERLDDIHEIVKQGHDSATQTHALMNRALRGDLSQAKPITPRFLEQTH